MSIRIVHKLLDHSNIKNKISKAMQKLANMNLSHKILLEDNYVSYHCYFAYSGNSNVKLTLSI